MTIRAPYRIAPIVLLLIAGCFGGGAGRRGGLPEAQVQQLPPQVATSYQLFAIRCSRCHTLSRPLNASIVEYTHWESYVARMRRHAGSGISPQDASEILVFLKYYADEKRKDLGGGSDQTPEPPPPPPVEAPPEGGGIQQFESPIEVVR